MAKHDLGGGLHYRVERRNGTTWIALTGNVSEVADFEPLKQLPPPLLIDPSEVTRINSLGVRGWIYFVREIEALGHTLTFERVPPVLVVQMSMLSNFMGTRSRSASVLAPYLCPSCQHEELALLQLTDGKLAEVKDTAPCPKCKATMEFDDVVTMYTELFVK
ncbi:MAG: STAS domain-containing protein [Kofleriaceae bacterium]|nr:STAS domain-containing protein [Kofleriaceae bacterium]